MCVGVVRIEREPLAEIVDRAVVVLLLEISGGATKITEREVAPLDRASLDQRGAAADLLLGRGVAFALAPGNILAAVSAGEARRWPAATKAIAPLSTILRSIGRRLSLA